MFLTRIVGALKAYSFDESLGPVTLIRGPHGSGKSARVAAIRTVLDKLTPGQAAAWLPAGQSELRFWAQTDTGDEIAVPGRPQRFGAVVVSLGVISLGEKRAPRALLQAFGPKSAPTPVDMTDAESALWRTIVRETADNALDVLEAAVSARRPRLSAEVNRIDAELVSARQKLMLQAGGLDLLPELEAAQARAEAAQMRMQYEEAVVQLDAVAAVERQLAARARLTEYLRVLDVAITSPALSGRCPLCLQAADLPHAKRALTGMLDRLSQPPEGVDAAGLTQQRARLEGVIAQVQVHKDAAPWFGPSLDVLRERAATIRSAATGAAQARATVERLEAACAKATAERDVVDTLLPKVRVLLTAANEQLVEAATAAVQMWVPRRVSVDPATGQWQMADINGLMRGKYALSGYEIGMLDLGLSIAYAGGTGPKFVLVDDDECKGIAGPAFVDLLRCFVDAVEAGRIAQAVIASAWAQEIVPPSGVTVIDLQLPNHSAETGFREAT